MKRIFALLLSGLALAAASCTHEVVVYRTHNHYYHPAPTYVGRERSPATVAGQPVHLANPGEPTTFRAETGN